MIEEIAIQIISIFGMALGGLSFGVCLGLGMWAAGVRMTVATVERHNGEDSDVWRRECE